MYKQISFKLRLKRITGCSGVVVPPQQSVSPYTLSHKRATFTLNRIFWDFFCFFTHEEKAWVYQIRSRQVKRVWWLIFLFLLIPFFFFKWTYTYCFFLRDHLCSVKKIRHVLILFFFLAHLNIFSSLFNTFHHIELFCTNIVLKFF